MQERHSNLKQYFEEQIYTTRTYVLPYLNEVIPLKPGMNLLEIGCGEGGNMVPFLEEGFNAIGVDLAEAKIALGKELLQEYIDKDKCQLIVKDIYDVDSFGMLFDVIVLRDVIEHIHDQEKFMGYLKKFLAPGGKVFFGFPPWQNPFGGHQQVCLNKFLSKLPYFHLLPRPLYKMVLKLFGEPDSRVESLLEVKETGISIERFNRILKKEGYKVDKYTPYLFNPNYEIKFKLKPKEQFGLINALPYFRNFFTTACYYAVSLKKDQ